MIKSKNLYVCTGLFLSGMSCAYGARMQEDQSEPVTIVYDLIEPRSETESKVIRGVFRLELKTRILNHRESSGASGEKQEGEMKTVMEINYADPVDSSMEVQLLTSGEIKILPVTRYSFQEGGAVLYKHGHRMEGGRDFRRNLRVPLYFPYHATFIDENGREHSAIAQFIPREIWPAIKPRRLPPIDHPGRKAPKREWGPQQLPPIKR